MKTADNTTKGRAMTQPTIEQMIEFLSGMKPFIPDIKMSTPREVAELEERCWMIDRIRAALAEKQVVPLDEVPDGYAINPLSETGYSEPESKWRCALYNRKTSEPGIGYYGATPAEALRAAIKAALAAQAGDGNRLPLEEFERGRQYGLKEALNCVCEIHKRFAKNQAAWNAISQAQKAINMMRVQVKRAAIAATKDGAG